METYQAPATTTPAQQQGGPQSSSSGSRTTNASNLASTSGPSVSGPATTQQPANTATPVEQDTAHIPQAISYWELPDAIRAEVPEIKFSVLVYNNDPAQRFVLVDGQRLGEGDDAQPGLVVEEIRRDGVIFSYRLYKFLVKR